MAKPYEHDEPLRQARQACLLLQQIVGAGSLSETSAAQITHLIAQFRRLDEKEQKQRHQLKLNGIKGGKYGFLGGRPRKESK